MPSAQADQHVDWVLFKHRLNEGQRRQESIELFRHFADLVLDLHVLCDAPVVVNIVWDCHKLICNVVEVGIPASVFHLKWYDRFGKEILTTLHKVPHSDRRLLFAVVADDQEHIVVVAEVDTLDLVIADSDLADFTPGNCIPHYALRVSIQVTEFSVG